MQAEEGSAALETLLGVATAQHDAIALRLVLDECTRVLASVDEGISRGSKGQGGRVTTEI
jgi:hypothetical protein